MMLMIDDYLNHGDGVDNNHAYGLLTSSTIGNKALLPLTQVIGWLITVAIDGYQIL